VQRIQEYNFDAPNKEQLLECLGFLMSEQEANNMWKNLCLSVNINDDDLSYDQLSEIFDLLSKKDGAVGVVGNSFKIRLISFQNILKHYVN